jgi:ABC-2 type transport system permease protein
MPPALIQLLLTRLREFLREPSAIFWVYGFPLLLAVVLGTAFMPREPDPLTVAVVTDDPNHPLISKWGGKTLSTKLKFVATSEVDAVKQLRTGKAALIFRPDAADPDKFDMTWDEKQTDRKSVLARTAVERQLFAEAHPDTPLPPANQQPEESGGRYIDFLIPGLIGNNLMGGGMFGVGFLIVDMRVRKLLKRYLATPMKKSDFMLSILLSRLVFTVLDVALLLGVAHLPFFGVKVHGNWLALGVLVFLGGACFAGIGLIVASRARTLETASGLMNFVMMSQWLLSGVFFSTDGFPDWLKVVSNFFPLTWLNNGLRAVINDGAGFEALLWPVVVLGGWGVVSFFGAIKLFKWR